MTFQTARGGNQLENRPLESSPRSLAHVHLLMPVANGATGGIYWNYTGYQYGQKGKCGGYSTVDLALNSGTAWKNFEATLRLSNWLDRRYGYPLGSEFAQPAEPAPGREASLTLRGSF
jgi:hypothetical protein